MIVSRRYILIVVVIVVMVVAIIVVMSFITAFATTIFIVFVRKCIEVEIRHQTLNMINHLR